MSILKDSFIQYIIKFLKSKIEAKQDKLVSGTNIKTINGNSLLGSGDVVVSGGSGGGTEYKEIQLSPSNADAIIPRYVNTSNVWAVQSNKDVACLFLVHKGDKIKIKANANYYCVYTLLTTKDIDYTVVPPFVGDWRRTTANANQEVEFEVPQRCYLYIYNKTSNGSNYFPQVAIRNAVFTGLTEVALRADKFTIARTISLSGGARGSVSFDGSANKSLDVTTLYEAYMSYGGKAIAGDVSPIDGSAVSGLWCNKFAYYNPDYINVEYTNNYSEDADGNESSDVIWTEYPYTNENYRLSKLCALVTGGEGNFYSSGSDSVGTAIAGKTRLRVTFNTYNARYLALKKLLIHVGASAKMLNNQIKVEVVSKTDYDAGNTNKFTHYSTNVVSGDDGWNSMSFASSFGSATYASVKKLRITFIVNGVDETNRPPVLHNIYMIGKHHILKDDNLATSGHLYKYDYLKNMEIPAALAPMTSKTQNIGYASRPWKNVYAQKYVTDGGTNQQVVLGNGSLKSLDELSPITDADAEILLDNHIHSINVNTNGNDVNISVIESSKNGNNWETEDNDITIPLATTTSAGVMSKEDKIKSDGLLIYYHLTEDEYNNHEIVSLYPLVLAIKDALFDSSTNKWKYDDSKTYDVRVKGWTLQDNGITYLNVNVRLLTSQGGHSIGFSGFVDVDFITETYFDAFIPLYIGYICGKYHIENDGMTIVAPEDSGFYIEI